MSLARTLSVPAGITSRSPGKVSASRCAARRGVRRDRVRREVELAVAPAGAHEGGVRRGTAGRGIVVVACGSRAVVGARSARSRVHHTSVARCVGHDTLRAHAWRPPRERRLHGRGRRCHRGRSAAVLIALVIALSGGGARSSLAAVFALRAGRARWSPATSGWTATSPSRRRCWRLAFAWGAFVATAAALVLQGLGGAGRRLRPTSSRWRSSSRRSPRRPPRALFLLLLLLWRAQRDRRRPRRHRLRRHGRHRLRVHREHPLLRRGVQRHDGIGPGGIGALTASRSCCAASSARSPTRCSPVHRHRRRHRGRAAARAPCGCWRRCSATSSRSAPHAALERLGAPRRRRGFFVVYLFADGAGLPRWSSARRLGRAASRAGC